MPKFHITKSGNATRCDATERPCPLKSEHYDTLREAVIAAAEEAFLPVHDEWDEGKVRVRPLEEGIITGPTRAVLPAGRYFLGDPCYTAGRDDTAWQQWVDVADATSSGMTQPIVGGSYNGHPVVASNTAYGDGEYQGSNGVSYSVDAGLIGAVPEAVIKGMKLTDSDLQDSGAWVEVTEPTVLKYDASDGTIHFGLVAIHTGDRLCEQCGGHVADDDWCENCDENYCERCGDQLDNLYDGWCANCAEDEFAEDED